MSRKARLTKLEAPLEKRWRDLWGRYYELLGSSPAGELVEPLGDAARRIQAADVFKDDGEVTAFVTALGERLGVTDAAAWTAWGTVSAPDDESEPDFSCWPHLLPEPPLETPGDLERLEAYQAEGEAETFALLYLRFAVLHARAHRAYLERCGPADSDTGFAPKRAP